MLQAMFSNDAVTTLKNELKILYSLKVKLFRL